MKSHFAEINGSGNIFAIIIEYFFYNLVDVGGSNPDL